MVRAVPRRPVLVSVPRHLAREESVERGDQVGVRAGADLDDHEAGGGMWDKDRQEPVAGANIV